MRSILSIISITVHCIFITILLFCVVRISIRFSPNVKININNLIIKTSIPLLNDAINNMFTYSQNNQIL